jgi:hypothetical protein
MSVVGWHLAVHDDLDGRVNNLEQYREGHIQHHQVEERNKRIADGRLDTESI